jgi:hypothetical protein
MKVSVFLPQTCKHLGLRNVASPTQLALDTVHMGKPSFGTANPEHYHLLRNSGLILEGQSSVERHVSANSHSNQAISELPNAAMAASNAIKSAWQRRIGVAMKGQVSR